MTKYNASDNKQRLIHICSDEAMTMQQPRTHLHAAQTRKEPKTCSTVTMPKSVLQHKGRVNAPSLKHHIILKDVGNYNENKIGDYHVYERFSNQQFKRG